MAADKCPHHGHSRRKLHRLLIAAVLTLLTLTLLSTLLTWAILHPTKPHFTLQDATIYTFNLTAAIPTLLTTNLQLTLSSRNPNAHIAVYYDGLRVSAAYRGQQITLPTLLPPAYLRHKDVAVWSPVVYGNAVHVAPYMEAMLGRERDAGTAMINVRVNGRVRWRVGRFVSRRYRLTVDCPAYVSFVGYVPNTVVVGSSSKKYRLILGCHVDVDLS